MTLTTTRRSTLAAAGLGASALLLAACGSDSDSDKKSASDAQPIDADAVATKGGKLLVWGWGGAMEPMVKGFMKAYPNVEAELVNVGTGIDHYTAVENAIQAGSGIPDVIVMEYQAVNQFALDGTLADLSGYGADKHAKEFTTGTWDAVQFDDGIYSMPMSSGPMALFYNKSVFDKHHLEVPETWEQFLEMGRALKKADPKAYIANDTGSANLLQGLLWQQGYKPYTVEGEKVGISLDGPEVETYTDLWQQLIDDELLAPIEDWSDEWYQGLANGSIASLISGAWMPGNFESGVAGGKGDWRVALMPQWESGEKSSAENGGSGLGVVDASKNKDLAYAFVEWATTGDGIATRINATFPSTVADLESEEFLGLKSDYFGGQPINVVFAESAANVPKDWSFLPYQVYANSILHDNIGGAYEGDEALADGLKSWQEALVKYGKDQGFTVEEG